MEEDFEENDTQEEAETEATTSDELTFTESRVLGCLLEKEATTPDHYPLTMNALVSACNQKSSRDPVTEFDEETVERGLFGLRDKQLAVKFHMSGSRVPKYKHTVDRVWHLTPDQQALVCVLLLRGVQTAGELNQRTERMHRFGSTEAVEQSLQTLIDFPAGAMVKRFPAGGGRRVVTYGHLLCGEPEGVSAPAAAGGGVVSAKQIVLEEEASWRKKLEDEVMELRGELSSLREEFARFREQFE
ncbi:MAG: YceH family protein [Verrucomicrobiota bacterium]